MCSPGPTTIYVCKRSPLSNEQGAYAESYKTRQEGPVLKAVSPCNKNPVWLLICATGAYSPMFQTRAKERHHANMQPRRNVYGLEIPMCQITPGRTRANRLAVHKKTVTIVRGYMDKIGCGHRCQGKGLSKMKNAICPCRHFIIVNPITLCAYPPTEEYP